MSEVMQRRLVYVIVLIAVLALLFMIRPSHPYHVTGVALPMTKTVEQPISPDQVVLYNAMPNGVKKIAWINVELHYEKASQANMDRVVAYTKALAAKHGANAVVVSRMVRSPPGPLALYLLHGIAIKYKY